MKKECRGKLFEKSFPLHPFQKLSDKIIKKRIFKTQTVDASETLAFATASWQGPLTLSAKKVVLYRRGRRLDFAQDDIRRVCLDLFF